MAITERQRNRLHNRANEVFGMEEGDALMELLPPTSWGEVATRRDLDQFATGMRSEYRAEFADFRAEMRSDFGDLRTEFADFRTEMRGEFADFRTDMRGEFADFRVEMRGELGNHRAETKADLADVHKAISRMAWTMTVAMIATVIASAGFAFTAGLAL